MAQRVVTTTGTGSEHAPADAFEVTLRVTAHDSSATAARSRVQDRTEAVVDSLLTKGVDEAQIQLTNFRLQEDDHPFGNQTEIEYLAIVTLVVDCNLTTSDEVIVAATDAGASIDDVVSQISDERREQLKQRALTNAMQKSRARAEAIAQAEGQTIGTVQTVTTQETDLDRLKARVDEALTYKVGFEIQPKDLTVSAKVEASYELTPQ